MKRQISDISESVPSIEKLIAEREELRMQKNWEAADTIRAKLQETYSVKIFDEERIWRSNDGKVGVIIRESSDGAKPTRLVDSQVHIVRAGLAGRLLN